MLDYTSIDSHSIDIQSRRTAQQAISFLKKNNHLDSNNNIVASKRPPSQNKSCEYTIVVIPSSVRLRP